MALDDAARDAARRRLDKNIVVEAGAGTGKTRVLTDRILFLLICGGPDRRGLALPEIVALTFTDKAAAEIQTRLVGRLEDVLNAVDGRPLSGADPGGQRQKWAVAVLAELKTEFKKTEKAVRQAAEKALHEMDRAEIGTIHSFASRILRLYPVQAGVDPAFRIDKTGEFFEELFQSEWALWLDAELGADSPRAARWLEVLPLATLGDIAELARALSREEAGQAEPGPHAGTAESFRRLASSFGELAKIRVSPGSSRILEAIGTVSAHFQELSDSLDAPPASLPRFWLKKDFKSERAKDWPKNWRAVEGREVYEDGTRLAAEVSRESEALVRRVAELVRPFAERFRALYAHRGFISFEGLLVRARNLVKRDADARRALKRRFRALLIDEFQDTDPLQGELLLYLAEDPGSSAADWREGAFRLEDGKVLVVGDPKQSIYRFRGADMRAYEMFTRRLLEQGALKCDLQTNFRSHAGLVEPVNAVFSAIMREEPGLQPNYLPLHPRPQAAERGAKEREPSVQWVLTPGRDEGLNAEAGQKLEAAWIADWVAEHCLARAEFKLKDVAVLFRSTSALSVYLDALKERGIRYVVESDRYFYGAQEVIDLVNLLRVLENPADGVSMLGLLRSPLAGLDDKEIQALWGAGLPDYRRDPPAAPDADARLRLNGLWDLLRRLRAHVGREPLGDFMDRLLRDSFLLELCGVAYHEEQTVSNLMKFRRMAAEAADVRGATLKEFIASVVRSMDESAKEGESPLADETLPAVRVLTVHKSKGLEYQVVFVPNMSGSPGGNDREQTFRADWKDGRAGLRLPRARAADLNMAMIEREEREREEREYVRLLYVALTRAQEKLFLLGRAQAKDGGSFAGLLQRGGAWPEPDGGETLSFGGRTFPVARLQAGAAPAERRGREHGARRVLPLKELAALWGARLAPRPAGKIFARPTGPAGGEGKRPAAAPEPGAPKGFGALVGEVCHRALERWDFRSADGAETLVGGACAVLRRGHPSADWEGVAREAAAVLKAFFASEAARSLARAEVLGREVPFLYPDGGAVVRGSIDLVYREGGRLRAADYKTDRAGAAAAPAYAAQAASYRKALESATGERCEFSLIFLRSGQIVACP